MPETPPDVLIPESAIQSRVSELARQISADYQAAGELLLIGVLRGSFIFLADLCRRLTAPARVEFIALSTYGDQTTTDGQVRMVMDLRTEVRGVHVLVVEDILDTGHTLDFLLEHLRARDPASLKSCVLVRKPARARVELAPDYLGFDIPDVWVVGYGLDCAGRLRNLPYIGVMPVAAG